jgi:hypothetical protein
MLAKARNKVVAVAMKKVMEKNASDAREIKQPFSRGLTITLQVLQH